MSHKCEPGACQAVEELFEAAMKDNATYRDILQAIGRKVKEDHWPPDIFPSMDQRQSDYVRGWKAAMLSIQDTAEEVTDPDGNLEHDTQSVCPDCNRTYGHSPGCKKEDANR